MLCDAVLRPFLQADQADLRAFEAATASARSQGLFFKNLYEPDLDEEQQQEAGSSAAAGSSGSSRSRAPLDPVTARKAAAVVTSSAEEEVSSPFRMYLFGAMAAVLALVVAQGGASSVRWRQCLKARLRVSLRVVQLVLAEAEPQKATPQCTLQSPPSQMATWVKAVAEDAH